MIEEHDLAAEYHEQETTPVPTAAMVSAVAQLWIFGLYELLRTWRQRGRDYEENSQTTESR